MRTESFGRLEGSTERRYGLQWVLGSGLLALCAAAWLLGGGPGWRGDAWLAIPAVLLLYVALLARWPGQPDPPVWQRLAVPASVLVLPLVQWLPLPLWLWHALPGRAPIALALAQAGVTPAHPAWSITPQRTEAAFWALSVPVAVYLATLLLPPLWQRRVLVLALAVGLLNVILGLAQLQSGGDPALFFYWGSDGAVAEGVFANRNHLASFLVALIPMAMALWLDERAGAGGSSRWSLRQSVLVLAMIFLAVGVTATQSRSGFALLMGVLVACGLWVMLQQRALGTVSNRWLQSALVITVLLIVQYTLYGLLQRLGADPLDDLRWLFARQSLRVAALTHGWGWGIGSFVQAYDLIGDASADQAFYVNHVHNDYLELWLEGGVVAVLAVGLAIAFLAVRWGRAIRGWRRADGTGSLLAVGAGLSLLALLLHSLVDYPLRTTAIEAYAAFLTALLLGDRGAAAVGADAPPRAASTVPAVAPLPLAANDPVLFSESSPLLLTPVSHPSIFFSRKDFHEK